MQRGRPCSSTWRVALAFLLGVAAVNGLCGENQRVRARPLLVQRFCVRGLSRPTRSESRATTLPLGMGRTARARRGSHIGILWALNGGMRVRARPNSTSTAQEMRVLSTSSCYCKENFHADFSDVDGYREHVSRAPRD